MANYSQGAGSGSSIGVAGVGYAYPDWFNLQASRMAAINPSFQYSPVLRSDCASISTELELNVAADATAGPLSTVTGGCLHVATGATPSSTSSILRLRDSTAAAPARVVSNSRTGIWGIVCRAKLTTAPVNTGLLILANMQDGSTDVYFGCRGATTVANYVVNTNGGAVDTGIAIDTTAFHDFALVNDGTTLRAYIDGVQVYSIAVSTLIGTGAGYPRWYCSNGLTGGNQETYFGKIAVFAGIEA